MTKTKEELKEEAAAEAFKITQRMNDARKAEASVWPHQAMAIIDIREVKGWTALNLESFPEWCAQLDVPIGVDKAKKLAATLSAFLDVGYDDLERLGECSYSKLSVTAAQVRGFKDPETGELVQIDPEEAIGDALVLPKPELEIKYAGGGSAPLNADDEPDKWVCPECRHVHARMPKHLEQESSDDPGEVDF